MAKEGLEKRFGVIAVQKGYITVEQLFEALKIQVMVEVNKGQHRLIGEILNDQGLMTFSQISDVEESMKLLNGDKIPWGAYVFMGIDNLSGPN